MSRFFVSYRRIDSQGSAGRLHEALVRYFGSDQVFMDLTTLRPGELWSETLFAELGHSDVLIVVIGPQWLHVADQAGRRIDHPDDVVRRELKMALERKKAVVPVLVDGGAMPEVSELPAELEDLAGHQFITLFAGSWADDVKRLITHLEELTRHQYRRGFWRSDVVDGSLHVGVENLDFRGAVKESIENREFLDPMFYYATPSSFLNWISLTKNPAFTSYHEAVAFFEREATAIAKIVLDQTGGSRLDFETSHLDYVSLGPGDGRKDRLLLRALFEATDPRSVSSIWYYPYDINASMIAHSLRELAQEPGIARKRLRVKAVIASFRVLPRFVPLYSDYQPGPNLLLLLGNTLGNMPNDRAFLEKLHQDAMSTGDLLLLEVRKRVELADRVEKARLADELRSSFTIGPLELLGVPYDPAKLSRTVEENRSQVAGSQSLCSYYRGLQYEGDEIDVRLSYIHEYEAVNLERVARNVGFDIVRDWVDEKSIIVLLLRKR